MVHLRLGKKVLIDGQQRITALTAAIVGQEVIGSDYKKKRIKIAFNPMDEVFEVSNPAIEKDSNGLEIYQKYLRMTLIYWSYITRIL